MLQTSSSLSEPKPANKLNVQSLHCYIQTHLRTTYGKIVDEPILVQQFEHGQSNPTYLLTLGDAKIVLRKKPVGKILDSAHAIEREHHILSALGSTRIPVPRVFDLCLDTSVVGTPFYLMSFADGTIFLDPNLPKLSPAQRSQIYQLSASTLASLHSVNPAAVGLLDLGKTAQNYCARQLKRWTAQYSASVSKPCVHVNRLSNWLLQHIPPSDGTLARPSIVHGDYRIDNLVFNYKPNAPNDSNTPLTVIAILDWELCTLGNPWADVAYSCLPFHLPSSLPDLLPSLNFPLAAGIPTEAQYVAAYCAASGTTPPPPSEWVFYVALALYRLAAILAGVQARSSQGNASSSRAAQVATDSTITSLAQTALNLIDRLPSGNLASTSQASEARAKAVASVGANHASPSRSPSTISPTTATLLGKVRNFIADHVMLAESVLDAHSGSDLRWTVHPLTEELKRLAKRERLWNLWIPPHLAQKIEPLLTHLPEDERALLLGPRLSHFEYAHLAEVMGRSLGASEAFNCSAPDTGNMEVLAQYGSEQQQRQWLLPLLAGEIRSCFAMTERGVASSDATNIGAEIRGDGDGYVVSGHKWWTSGASDPRCKICIFMGKTDKSAPAHRQQSMVLVPMDAPGVRVIRAMSLFGYDDAPHGHPEVEFHDVRVGLDALILGEGRGFEIAQGRLGPGRLHHCMRLVGMAERAMDLMAARGLSRTVFGRSLSSQGGFLQSLGNCRVQLEAARSLVLSAADALDKRGGKEARAVISAAKVMAPRTVLFVLDSAIQAHGAEGVSQDLPLARLWAAARTLRIADGPDEVHLDMLARMEVSRVKAMAKL